MITFFSNFFNDHQLALCEAFYRVTGGEFRFVETEPISEDRLKLGFVDKSGNYPFIVKAHAGE